MPSLPSRYGPKLVSTSPGAGTVMNPRRPNSVPAVPPIDAEHGLVRGFDRLDIHLLPRGQPSSRIERNPRIGPVLQASSENGMLLPPESRTPR